MSPAAVTVDHLDSLFPTNKDQSQVEDHTTVPGDEGQKLQDSGILDNGVPFTSAIPSVGIPVGLESAEHALMGDTLFLKLTDGTSTPSSEFPFDFYDGKLKLTYGQINALAGDFYGTDEPICQGTNEKDQIARFMRAYNTLAQNPSRQPQEAQAIIAALQNEVDKVNEAISDGKDPSETYAHLPDTNVKFQLLTATRPSHQPSYLGLASSNLDHFGADAETAYNAGHTAALQLAAGGDLYNAYRVNAFADHFLGDRFSSGHLRTPRRMLTGDLIKDYCAKKMHDEDSAIGLRVQNPRGDSWTMYGDKRLADGVNRRNMRYCNEAIQKSADEIYDCFKTKQVPPPSSFGVWQIAPTLASANAKQDCCPLFVWRQDQKTKEWRRKNIDVRMNLDFTNDFWYATTAGYLATSSRWKYPMTLGP